MTNITYNVSTPTLSTVGTVTPGQPFMVSGVQEVYQAVAAESGGVRQVRRLSDGFLENLGASTAVLLVAITDATIGDA